MAIVKGDYQLELSFVGESDVFLSYFDNASNNDVCCKIEGGKIFKIEYSDKVYKPGDKNPYPSDKTEISLTEFIELVRDSVLTSQDLVISKMRNLNQ